MPITQQAILRLADVELTVQVQLREGWSTIDDRREIGGRIWFTNGAPDILQNFFSPHRPGALELRDGRIFEIVFDEVSLGSAATASFQLAEHFREREEAGSEDL